MQQADNRAVEATSYSLRGAPPAHTRRGTDMSGKVRGTRAHVGAVSCNRAQQHPLLQLHPANTARPLRVRTQAAAAVVGGDPRRPDEAQRPPRPVQDDDLDIYLVISMMIGLAGFMLKVCPCARTEGDLIESRKHISN